MGEPQWESLFGLAFWMELSTYKSCELGTNKLKLGQNLWKKYLADDAEKRYLFACRFFSLSQMLGSLPVLPGLRTCNKSSMTR
jgi:hypothetical protein